MVRRCALISGYGLGGLVRGGGQYGLCAGLASRPISMFSMSWSIPSGRSARSGYVRRAVALRMAQSCAAKPSILNGDLNVDALGVKLCGTFTYAMLLVILLRGMTLS